MFENDDSRKTAVLYASTACSLAHYGAGLSRTTIFSRIMIALVLYGGAKDAWNRTCNIKDRYYIWHAHDRDFTLQQKH